MRVRVPRSLILFIPGSAKFFFHRQIHPFTRSFVCFGVFSSNKTGTAYTFFTRDDAKQAKALIKVLTEAKQVIHPKLAEMERMGGGMSNRWGGGGGRRGGGFGRGGFRGRR